MTRLGAIKIVDPMVDLAYATVLERWWGMASTGPLKGRFQPLEVLAA